MTTEQRIENMEDKFSLILITVATCLTRLYMGSIYAISKSPWLDLINSQLHTNLLYHSELYVSL